MLAAKSLAGAAVAANVTLALAEAGTAPGAAWGDLLAPVLVAVQRLVAELTALGVLVGGAR